MNAPDRPGLARSPGITYQQLLDTDTRPVPEVLRLESPVFLGSEDVSKERFTSRAWHEAEVERLWKRVWQFACREEHIPEPGDYILYEIAGLSFIVVRAPDRSIKAYPNACLHRGRRLKDYDGHCAELRCAFHGFAWATSGELTDVPARWDFPHIDNEAFRLPECRVDTWAGFVFLNMDPECGSLWEFLGEMVEHFATWDLENAYVEAHVAKVIPANWKITQEAFCEAYHVSGTHPQVMPYLGDTNSQVDIWENFSRVITPGGTPSPLFGSRPPTEDAMMRAMLDTREGSPTPVPIPEGQTMRAIGAELSRKRWRPIVGDRVDTMSDAELMDSLDYTLFPNFHPWGAYNRIVYRFRPNGDDHRSSIMECLFLSPFSGERPKPAPIHWLTDDEKFSAAAELGMLGKVFDQDLYNMPNVQKGLETTFKPGVTLGNYQESKVRWIHHKLTEWVGRTEDVLAGKETGK
jgi:phenylpropionate dioxygenase-like ring-hydroxylating dioxygenase large terminal subunit